METINNLANAASKAVFGSPETKEEPLSGAQGDPSKGEPFDKGNLEPSEVDKSDTTDTPTPSDSKKTTTGNAGPTTTKDSSVVKEDSTKGQNDVRSPSDPTTGEKHAEDANNVDDSGEGINSVKVDGPGPKPIEQVAREHGGDAGNANKEPASPTPDSNVGVSMKPKTGSGEDDDGPQTVSHGEGTGEKYVKSHGLKADGGDFDAALPGAGREADRLLEEKGVHTQQNPPSHKEETVPPTAATTGHPKVDTTANHTKNGNIMSGSPDKKEKRNLGDRIKAKLHIHKASEA